MKLIILAKFKILKHTKWHPSNKDLLYYPRLSVRETYRRSYGSEIELENDLTKQIFDTLLPKYIRQITDEILQKIDEIDYLVNSKELQEDLP